MAWVCRPMRPGSFSGLQVLRGFAVKLSRLQVAELLFSYFRRTSSAPSPTLGEGRPKLRPASAPEVLRLR